MSQQRIEEIKERLSKSKAGEVTFLNSSEVDFIFSEIEKRDQVIERLEEALEYYSHDKSVMAKAALEDAEKFLRKDPKSFVEATKPAEDKELNDMNTRFNTLMAESYLKHKAEIEGEE